jgi:nitroimidazol reductase NimA-like FMN-containing flavoprotein (pyridoxamine 5'-phosphate oxidase superfamily)
MGRDEPVAELDPAFSGEDATPIPWPEGRRRLEEAEIAWLTTVRPDGRPHVTPLIFVCLDGVVFFGTGERERKAKNLARNPHVVITTGSDTLEEGLDVVVEGEAILVTDGPRLRRVSEAFASKYVPREGAKPWHFEVRRSTFFVDGGPCLLYEVAPTTAFGFGKGAFSQTRWRF